MIISIKPARIFLDSSNTRIVDLKSPIRKHCIPLAVHSRAQHRLVHALCIADAASHAFFSLEDAEKFQESVLQPLYVQSDLAIGHYRRQWQVQKTKQRDWQVR